MHRGSCGLIATNLLTHCLCFSALCLLLSFCVILYITLYTSHSLSLHSTACRIAHVFSVLFSGCVSRTAPSLSARSGTETQHNHARVLVPHTKPLSYWLPAHEPGNTVIRSSLVHGLFKVICSQDRILLSSLGLRDHNVFRLKISI